MRTSRRSFVLVTLMLGAASLSSAGSVVYSDFGPGMSFDTSHLDGWGIYGIFYGSAGAVSEEFTPAANYIFTDAQVAVFQGSGPSSIDVYLQANSGGQPGAVIEEIPISGFGATPTIVTANSALFPALQAGTSYWLTLVAGDPSADDAWSWNSIGKVGFAHTYGGSPTGPWTIITGTSTAFEIDGTPTGTPEPSSLLLFGFGLTILACRAWRRRLL